MEVELVNKVAIVTGGSKGLGRGIATEMAKAGASVIIASRDSSALNAAKYDIEKISGREALVVATDLSNRNSAEACVQAALMWRGRIDILVNCAGATKRGDFFELSDQDWEDGYALKLHGAVRMCRAAWPHLIDAKGVVINIAGVSMRTPTKDFTIGASVNSALTTFSKSLADRGIDDGVRVNVINPGYIASERLDRRVDAMVESSGKTRDDIYRKLLSGYGVPRFGEPIEIGQLAVFLASDKASYMHGIAVDIDGGGSRGQ
ncbi:SDR family oxidoreductase [Nitratireductor thuwali]|uniref:Glucose 1-dehydrogenase 4 n=1 Tax=Nitratireductor thuwali TaxID=2267699 RepID=A0ABY5MIK7_9HYPH|nr:Glucose 1-dehydrogenase 4 [Nitratireductor thuwali]